MQSGGRPAGWPAGAVSYCRYARILKEAVTSMAWSWQFEQADGSLVPSRGMPRETFSSQGDAESWLGENWRDLLASGVDQVTLLEEGRVEYGPMSLHPDAG